MKMRVKRAHPLIGIWAVAIVAGLSGCAPGLDGGYPYATVGGPWYGGYADPYFGGYGGGYGGLGYEGGGGFLGYGGGYDHRDWNHDRFRDGRSAPGHFLGAGRGPHGSGVWPGHGFGHAGGGGRGGGRGGGHSR